MKTIGEMSQLEMAAYVQTILAEKEIKVVLSGGAATSFHCENKYVSFDIDLVNIFSCSHEKIRKILLSYGFMEESRYFRHPESQFLIEFPPGPLSVGLEPVSLIVEVILETGVLKVISPTDSVKDRLAAFYHWGDQQCLNQAILIVRTKKIDMREIERWSENEGKLKDFYSFIKEAKL